MSHINLCGSPLDNQKPPAFSTKKQKLLRSYITLFADVGGGGLATGLLLVGGGLRIGGRAIVRRWPGGSALTARRGLPGGGKAVCWWRAGGWLTMGWW